MRALNLQMKGSVPNYTNFYIKQLLAPMNTSNSKGVTCALPTLREREELDGKGWDHDI